MSNENNKMRSKLIALAIPMLASFYLLATNLITATFSDREIQYSSQFQFNGTSDELSTLSSQLSNWKPDDPRLINIKLTPFSNETKDPAAEGCNGNVVKLSASYITHAFDTTGSELFGYISNDLQNHGLGSHCTGLSISISGGNNKSSVHPLAALALVPAVLPILFFIWLSRRNKRPLWINWSDWLPRVSLRKSIGLGIGYALICLVLSITLNTIGLLFGWKDHSEPTVLNSGFWWAILLACVLAPVFEEYIFRAWMLEKLSRAHHKWMALWLSSGAFAVAHAASSFYDFVTYVFLGSIFGLLWLRTRSLLAVVIAHGLYNLLILSLTQFFAGSS